jgi:hypothetical protein
LSWPLPEDPSRGRENPGYAPLKYGSVEPYFPPSPILESGPAVPSHELPGRAVVTANGGHSQEAVTLKNTALAPRSSLDFIVQPAY